LSSDSDSTRRISTDLEARHQRRQDRFADALVGADAEHAEVASGHCLGVGLRCLQASHDRVGVAEHEFA
jgi:hypothetical protein